MEFCVLLGVTTKAFTVLLYYIIQNQSWCWSNQLWISKNKLGTYSAQFFKEISSDLFQSWCNEHQHRSSKYQLCNVRHDIKPSI